MNEATLYADAVGKIRIVLSKLKSGNPVFSEVAALRDEVFARYQPLFSLPRIPKLSREEFTSFLYFENNHHWSGLYRKGLHAATDMDRLRNSLTLLLDEGRPIEERFPLAIDMVEGMGRATATAILTVAFPQKYGVWNNTSESAMRKLKIWPEFRRGDNIGAKYRQMNAVLVDIVSDLGTDFWTLDAAWWKILEDDGEGRGGQGATGPLLDIQAEAGSSFALERQLEDFLLENWDRTELGKEWGLYGTKDNPEAGNQFPTDVGPIDLLAVHKFEPRILVIELKRNQTADSTVGQVLRYIGWINKHLAEGRTVEGMIIAHQSDKATEYALLTVPHVKLMKYEIQFHLSPIAGGSSKP
jgi:hypothetical protein